MPRTYKPTGKPRGRPKGSTNKPKTVAEFLDRAIKGTLVNPPNVKPPRKNLKVPTCSPERSEQMRQMAAARTPASFKNVGRKKGVPNHTHEAHYRAVQAAIRPEITRIVKIMKKNGELPEDLGIKAAVAALLEIVSGDEKASDRIAAARTFLDFHKTKPVAKQEVTIKTPAEYLRELAAEDDTDSE